MFHHALVSFSEGREMVAEQNQKERMESRPVVFSPNSTRVMDSLQEEMTDLWKEITVLQDAIKDMAKETDKNFDRVIDMLGDIENTLNRDGVNNGRSY
jgi:hypothetical protein